MNRSTLPLGVGALYKYWNSPEQTLRCSLSFQRNSGMWNLITKSGLVVSVLTDSFIPAVVFLKDKVGTNEKGKDVFRYEILDGQQRLTSLFEFLDDQWALHGAIEPIEFDGFTYDVAGKKFSELEPELQDAIKGYSNFHDGILVIDDFGQGEPTMFFNNGLYRYAGGGEVTLIHDFSGIEENWYWTSIYTDADRTHLMFSGGPLHSEELKIVDLKTFEVTDEVYVLYDADSNGMWEFWEAEVNGVTVDESTAWAAADQWRSICNIALCDTDINYETDLNAAWKEYESRS